MPGDRPGLCAGPMVRRGDTALVYRYCPGRV